MRIAYIYDSAYPFSKGGGERRIYEVARRLSHRGHQVSIISMKCWDGPRTLRDNGLCYRAISPRMACYHHTGRRSISQALRFGAWSWQLLRHEKYDVIDCGQWPYFHFFAAKAFSLFRQTPFIVTWYEVWKNHWLEYLGKAGLIGMAAERVFSRFPDKIVAISDRTHSDLLDLGVRNERMELIPNGADCSHIRAVAPGSTSTDLAYFGRLKNHKNVDVFIKAVACLKKLRPGISAVIIGDGPESHALRSMASQLDVAENIVFTGALEDFDHVVRWLKASKIFVCPSTKEGGGSITLLEANACGLPVIAIDCPNGIDPRLIRQGQNGYLVNLDPLQIARTAQDLLGAPERLKDNALASLEFAANFDWDSIALQHEQLYYSELSRK